MSVAGPSRLGALPPAWHAPRERIESTYEQDLLRLLDRLSPLERDELQASMKRRVSAGGRLSDHEIALNDVIQQARDLAALEQDRMLAERIAVEEDSDVGADETRTVDSGEAEAPGASVDAQPNGKKARKRKKKKKKKRKQQGEADQSAVQPETPRVLPQSNEGTYTKKIDDQQNNVVPPVLRWAQLARDSPPLPKSKGPRTDTADKGKGREQEKPAVLPSMSAWAKGPPAIVNRKDAKGKGKEQPGVLVARNHALPPRWQSGETPPSSTALVFGSLALPQPALANTPSKAPVVFGSLASTPPSTHSAASKPTKVKRPTGHDCVICQDPIHGAEIHAPCGHYYDISCITDLFQSATRDETLFPPRCCKKNIPFTQVQPHLSQTLIATFQEKKIEFSTLKRVYCSSPTCSRFLGPLSEGDSADKVYACPASGCGRKTCAKCREQYSDPWSHVCRPDADATQVLELSRTSGWARCPGCTQMIELNFGCFHMTCRCRTEFCYLCRARWKTCLCVQWDDDRLLAAAERRVDARLGQQARPAPALAPARAATAAPNRWAMLFDEPPTVQTRRPEPVPTAATVQPAVRLPAASSSASHGQTMTFRDWLSAFEEEYPDWTSSDEEYLDWAESGEEYLNDWASNTDPTRERMIREMMERLRVDHDCDHIHWRYQDEGGHCDGCGEYLPLYLFRCRGCEMLACNRCRRNRL